MQPGLWNAPAYHKNDKNVEECPAISWDILFFSNLMCYDNDMNAIHLLILYFVIINFISFAAMGIDKRRAVKHVWRIPESTLFVLAIIGGSIGSIAGMQLFRHKTRHWYFVYGMPAILIVQIVITLALILSPIEFLVM